MSIQPGRYRHYKGREYIVLEVARHSETEEELVVYRQDYGDRSVWVRPLAMFQEQVEVDGRLAARFARVEASAPSDAAEGHGGEQGSTENLLAELPQSLEQERVTVLAGNAAVRIERIVSTGQASPDGFWYDQPEQEWVAVLRGAARLEFEGGESVELGPGDQLLIPARRRHRVAWTSGAEPTVWLAVFFPAELARRA